MARNRTMEIETLSIQLGAGIRHKNLHFLLPVEPDIKNFTFLWSLTDNFSGLSHLLALNKTLLSSCGACQVSTVCCCKGYSGQILKLPWN